jgi:hypothetical protein
MRTGMTINKVNETWVGGKTVVAEAVQVMTNAPADTKMTITGNVPPATHRRAQQLLGEEDGAAPSTTTGTAASLITNGKTMVKQSIDCCRRPQDVSGSKVGN